MAAIQISKQLIQR